MSRLTERPLLTSAETTELIRAKAHERGEAVRFDLQVADGLVGRGLLMRWLAPPMGRFAPKEPPAYRITDAGRQAMAGD